MSLDKSLVRLIELLRRAWPAGRTVEDLARELNVQTWRAAELVGLAERLGSPIEHTGQSHRLDPAATPLLAELIEWGLGTQRIGRSVLVFEQTASTNDVAWQATRRRDSDGLAVVAETQTAGRGRLGRAWHDRPGASLLFSVLLLDVPQMAGLANRLTMAASVAAAEAIQQSVGLTVAIRWPNDLYVHGRKLAGILLESRSAPGERRPQRLVSRPSREDPKTGTGSTVLDVVLGVGVNCNQSAADFPAELRTTACSLAGELGHRVDRIGLLRAMLARLDHWLDVRRAPSAEELHGQYLRWMDHQARRVRLHHDGQTIEATVRDVDPIDGLIVELPAGGVAHFPPSAVTVEWLDGPGR